MFLFIFFYLFSCLDWTLIWRRNPAGNYMFKVNNRNTRTRCEICSKLTIKTPEQRHLRLKVKSWWSTTFLLHSVIISSPHVLNNDWKIFYTFRVGATYIFNTVRPSSLYKLKSFLLCFSLILFNVKMRTNSQISARPYALILTTKRFSSLFIQGFSLQNKSDFLAWYIICISSLLISDVPFVKLSALVNSFSDIDE